jgi:GNAT superfamily N-acetyltransferase
MYADYIRERTLKSVYEDEHGFCIYTYIMNDECVLLEEFFIRSDIRKMGLGKEMADKIINAAKKRGCRYAMCTVDPTASNASESLKAIIAYGFEPWGVDNNLYVLMKNL